MITVIKNIVRACYDRKFYVESEGDSFGRRFLHLYVLYLIVLSVLSLNIINLYLKNRPQIDSFPKTLSTDMKNFFPRDLELTFQDNELSINQQEPYIWPETYGLKRFLQEGSSARPAHLIVIDTQASVDDIGSYDAMFLAMKKGFAISHPNGKVEYYQYATYLKDITQPFTFDSISFSQIVNKVRPLLDKLPLVIGYLLVVVIIFVVLVVPLFLASGTLIPLLITSAIGYLVASMIGRRHTYRYVYKLGMYSMLPVIILQEFVGRVVQVDLSNVWWLVALLLMVVFIPPSSSGSDGVVKPTGIQPPKIV